MSQEWHDVTLPRLFKGWTRLAGERSAGCSDGWALFERGGEIAYVERSGSYLGVDGRGQPEDRCRDVAMGVFSRESFGAWIASLRESDEKRRLAEVVEAHFATRCLPCRGRGLRAGSTE